LLDKNYLSFFYPSFQPCFTTNPSPELLDKMEDTMRKILKLINSYIRIYKTEQDR